VQSVCEFLSGYFSMLYLDSKLLIFSVEIVNSRAANTIVLFSRKLIFSIQIFYFQLELALMVEKLQELRSMRVQKMKKQGHFLPEEDDKYLERVKAAVEEEERQAASAARTDAAKDAILTAEESRKAVQCSNSREDDSDQAKSAPTLEQNQRDPGISGRNHHASQKTEHELHKDDSKGHGHYDSVSSLPFEFYHYYHGSSYDMGTLIEVTYAGFSTSCYH
jgi:hypothetical protein